MITVIDNQARVTFFQYLCVITCNKYKKMYSFLKEHWRILQFSPYALVTNSTKFCMLWISIWNNRKQTRQWNDEKKRNKTWENSLLKEIQKSTIVEVETPRDKNWIMLCNKDDMYNQLHHRSTTNDVCNKYNSTCTYIWHNNSFTWLFAVSLYAKSQV